MVDYRQLGSLTMFASGTLERELATVLVTRDRTIAKRAADSLRESGIQPSVKAQRIFPFFTLTNIQVKKSDEEQANTVLAGLPREADLRKRPAFRRGFLLFVVAFLLITTVYSIRISSLPRFLRILLLFLPLAAAQQFLRRPIERLPNRLYRFAAEVGMLLGSLIYLFLAAAVLGLFGA